MLHYPKFVGEFAQDGGHVPERGCICSTIRSSWASLRRMEVMCLRGDGGHVLVTPTHTHSRTRSLSLSHTASTETAGDPRSTEGISNKVEALEGLSMDLGALLPHTSVSYRVNIAHLSHFSTSQRSVPPSVIFAEVPK